MGINNVGLKIDGWPSFSEGNSAPVVGFGGA